MPVINVIKNRRDTAANWASVNPVLSAGEFGIETDTNKLKIGNGTTAWNSLAYFASDTVQEIKYSNHFMLMGA